MSSGSGWRRAATPPTRGPSDRATHHREPGRSRSDPRDSRWKRYEAPARSGRSQLGQTSGIAAAGAWAARWEMASLLEARCSVENLVSDIRSGREGDHILQLGAQTSAAGSLRSWSPVGSGVKAEERKTSPDDKEKSNLFGGSSESGDFDEEIAKQRAILESLVDGSASNLPPWAQAPSGGAASGIKRNPSSSAYPYKSSKEPVFGRPATPPSEGSRLRGGSGLSLDSRRPVETAPQELQQFSKRAVPPQPPPEAPRRSRERDRDRSRRRRRRRDEDRDPPNSMMQRELTLMEKFQKDCLHIFKVLKVDYKVEMELTQIVAPQGTIDVHRFDMLTKPNRASTGLNYTRLMLRFLDWRQKRTDLESRDGGVDAKLGVLDFVEALIQEQTGYLTPRAFLYAVDFFSTAFGYNAVGGHWNRAKRLAGSYAASKVTPTSRAPCFVKATLNALEMAVLDPFLSAPERIACGKLRLCAQASVRYDDLLNTPLHRCEWVRRPGQTEIIGLRSRALRGKTGARSWIAALGGVSADNDKWLPTLMRLVVEAHGSTWKQDDHFGKQVSSNQVSFTRAPSSITSDVSLVKGALEKYHKESMQIGMDLSEIQVLRWHGAKATLSSVMQHIGIQERAVRFQGNWTSRAESMPDTYLREAQTLLITAQQKCLAYLRAGGDIVKLVGTPLEGESGEAAPAEPPPEDPAEVDRKAKAMETPVLPSAAAADVEASFLDEGFDDTGSLQDGVIERELKIFEEGDNWEECLVPIAEDDDELYPSPSVVGEEVEPKGDAEKDDQDDLDEYDSEGMVSHWVHAKTMHANPKIHLPSSDAFDENGMPVKPAPKCGSSGTFEFAKVEDPLDASTTMCRRCLPKTTESGCNGICSHMHLGRKSLLVRRCYRRCGLGADGHEDHLCPIHSK